MLETWIADARHGHQQPSDEGGEIAHMTIIGSAVPLRKRVAAELRSTASGGAPLGDGATALYLTQDT